jgi:hypothetical protein
MILFRTGLALWCCFCFACGKEPTSPAAKPPQPPTLIAVAGPASAAAPAEIASFIQFIVASLRSTCNYLQDASQLTAQVDANVYTWSSSAGGLRLKLKAVQRSEDSVTWSAVLDGQADDGSLYTEWTIFLAVIRSLQQEWYLYEANSQNLVLKVQAVSNKDIVTYTVALPVMGETAVIINYSDKSGSYTRYLGAVKVYEASWLANGSGEYKQWSNAGVLLALNQWQ